ncbi:MAG: MFS transporter [Pseudomonadota bacterium]
MSISNKSSRWWVLGGMGAILGIILLDETIIAVALPTIQKELGLSSLTAHWVVNVYLLVLAGLAGAAGRMGDILGGKVLIILGLLIFGGASASGGFAQNGTELILARLVQGIGAALIFPLSIYVISNAFAPSERGMALGVYGAIGTIFLAAGPFLGGVLTEYLTWRWIFWVNPPIVLIVALITMVAWKDPAHLAEESFDWLGMILLITGLGLLVFGIMEGPGRGWQQPDVYVPLLAGVLLLLALIRVELRVDTPLIAVSLFANPAFTAFNLIVFTAQFAKMAIFVFGALYFQDQLGISPVWAGAALLPSVLPQIFVAAPAGRATDQLGARAPSLWGIGGLTLGMAGLALGAGLQELPILFGGLILLGLAMPFLFIPTQHAVMSTVPPGMQGQAGGIIMTGQLLGGTVGMAVCSTVFSTLGTETAVFWAATGFAALVCLFSFAAIDRSHAKRAA